MDRKKRILVKEDDDIVRTIIAKLAGRRGVEVVNAPDGREAIKLIQLGSHFDAIFLDLLMPNASGWDVLDVIQEQPSAKDTPVVILSGAPVSPRERNKLRSKVTAFMDKETFTISDFEALIDRLLGK